MLHWLFRILLFISRFFFFFSDSIQNSLTFPWLSLTTQIPWLSLTLPDFPGCHKHMGESSWFDVGMMREWCSIEVEMMWVWWGNDVGMMRVWCENDEGMMWVWCENDVGWIESERSIELTWICIMSTLKMLYLLSLNISFEQIFFLWQNMIIEPWTIRTSARTCPLLRYPRAPQILRWRSLVDWSVEEMAGGRN